MKNGKVLFILFIVLRERVRYSESERESEKEREIERLREEKAFIWFLCLCVRLPRFGEKGNVG